MESRNKGSRNKGSRNKGSRNKGSRNKGSRNKGSSSNDVGDSADDVLTPFTDRCYIAYAAPFSLLVYSASISHFLGENCC